MRALLMASLLLLACMSWASAAQSQHAVRLCGRELVRAIVYTCGGSRWRRNLSELTTDGQRRDGWGVVLRGRHGSEEDKKSGHRCVSQVLQSGLRQARADASVLKGFPAPRKATLVAERT
ncbi:hypothetical protein P4O66_017168 [Electrophorus voltai]|uniref:Insulin-like domain-containing protein n=1 Tax=Electrophorus voltai TaxID=2609070 RepID=A0AAD8YUN7_9TELE|nr:hypothetical protein P4O66_017168 [Electrophorus voltai]